ncbi:uncharacterized protein [Salminus brasiliensis]|uniref:uncharacterized protein n=1 Tax=Salminus brasiliensis TaxID=930266 RepID=UPI003B834070
MPLSSKEKSARFRERIKKDPEAWEAHLAKRKESYERRKREGRIGRPLISQLSRTEKEKVRQQWKQYQRKYRERKKATEESLRNLDSAATAPVELPPNADGQNARISVDVRQPDVRRSGEPPVNGTLAIHRVFSTEPGNITYWEVSCSCTRPHICQHHKTTAVNSRTDRPSAGVQDGTDLNKFILVKYEGQPLVGQVLQINGEEVEVCHI